jgi:hypothetical protein
MRRLFIAFIILDFALLTGYALEQHGYWGIIAYHLPSSAGWQVIADLVISCVIIARWIFADARRNGRNPWPYLLLMLVLGSFGPLFYLLFERRDADSSSEASLKAQAIY